MSYSHEKLKMIIADAIKSGLWMIRRSDDGVSYNGFKWNPIGKWTEAPDWNERAECGGGLHGCGPNSKGFYGGGRRLDFCIIEPPSIDIGEDKLKVRRAMIVMTDELPEGLHVGGSLDLEGTGITSLPEGLHVGGRIYR